MADVEPKSKEPDAKRMRLESGAGVPLQGNSDLAELNVGGQIFVTTFQTLTKEPSLLSQLVAAPLGLSVRRDSSGRIFIDRDPTHFRWILNYLRDGFLVSPPSSLQDRLELQQEARFYQLNGILPFLENSPLSNVEGKDASVSFATSRPSSKGIFYIPGIKWNYFGLIEAKESWDCVGFKFDERGDEVDVFSLTLGDDESNIIQRERLFHQKLHVDKIARVSLEIGQEILDVAFWFERSLDRAFPQVFSRLSRGNVIFCSRGLDFVREEDN